MLEDKNDLPGDMRKVCDALGLDAAKTLMKKMGGERVYIPSKPGRLAVKAFVLRSEKKTIREMADEAGVSRTTIFRCLGSRR
jgi:hypothetical protein